MARQSKSLIREGSSVVFESKQAAKTRRNREAILNAAMFITKQYGGDALTVKNICEIAKVSNGSFYHLFSSKDDLVYYYLAYAFDQYLKAKPTDDANMSASERILDLYDSYIDVCLDAGSEFVSLIYSTSNESLNFFERPKEQSIILDKIGECLKAGVDSGEYKSDLDVRKASFHVASIVTGVMFYWCVCKGNHIDPKAEVLDMLTAYLHALER